MLFERAEYRAAQRAHNDPEVIAAANLFVTVYFGGCHHRTAAFFQELARTLDADCPVG